MYSRTQNPKSIDILMRYELVLCIQVTDLVDNGKHLIENINLVWSGSEKANSPEAHKT